MNATLHTSSDRYLERPHDRASLADHRALAIGLRQCGTPFGDAVLRFLEVRAEEIVIHRETIASCELPNIHRAIRQVFPDWRLKHLTGPPYCADSDLWAPKFRRVELRPRRFRSYMCEGAMFFESDDGARRIIDFDTSGGDEPNQEVRILGRRQDNARLRREFGVLRRWARRHAYLRRQAIRPDGSLIDLRRPVGWEDVALAPAVRETLLRNTMGFFELRRAYRRNRIPQRRGVLLFGPPGTGKTMIGRVLASQRNASFLWVTSADIDNDAEKLRWVFTLARRVRPTIIFFEDLDMFAKNRGWGTDGVLGELLSQMDGLEANDGLIIVATTNDLEAIEPAVRERPSRFDVVVEIGLPELAARRQILAQRWAAVEIDPALIDQAARDCDGLSGAQVCEVATQAMQAAIIRGAIDADLRCRVSGADILPALERLTGKKRTAIGFHSAS